jgi:putative type II/III system pilus formation protein
MKMKTTPKNESNRKVNGLQLLMLVVLGTPAGIIPASAQVTVQLPQLVLEAKHTEYVETQNPGTPNIVDVKTSNPSVATAVAYRAKQVQIVAVAPGKTTVEFFDTTQRVLYKVPVWVTAPNPTGGGGQGYNPRLTQLPQIVMLVQHTENAHTPNDRAARISGVRSSNPRVATARSDPPRGIQIYAVALGDTFIEFTDDTTGTTYQVHVWVRNPGDPAPQPAPGSNPNPDPNAGPNSKSTSSRSPKSAMQQIGDATATWSDGQGNCGNNRGVGYMGNGTGFLRDFQSKTRVAIDGNKLSVTFVGVRGPIFKGVSGPIRDDGTFELHGRDEKYDEDYTYRGRIGMNQVDGIFTRLAHYVGDVKSPRCTATWTVLFPASGLELSTTANPSRSTTRDRGADQGGAIGTPLLAALIVLGLAIAGGGLLFVRTWTKERPAMEPPVDHTDDSVPDGDEPDILIEEVGGTDPPPTTVPERKERSNDELAELTIKKEQAAAMEPVELGRSLIKYTITVSNNGPAAAQHVVVADYMVQIKSSDDDVDSSYHEPCDPLRVRVAQDATSDKSEGTCQITKNDKGHFVSGKFTLASLAKGATWTITYHVEPTEAGHIVNAAAFKCDNLKRGWRKQFTLWTVKNGYFQDNWARWMYFRKKDGFEWSVDAALTDAKVVQPSKKP